MAFAWSNQVWMSGPPDPTERLVLAYLAHRANEEGHCWPSVDNIAGACCMSRRNAQRVLRRLEAGGWLMIDIQRGKKSSGSYASNSYWLTKSDAALSSLKPDIAVSSIDGLASLKPDTQGIQTGHTGSVNATRKASKSDTAMSEEYTLNHQRTEKERTGRAMRASDAFPVNGFEGGEDRARKRFSEILRDLYGGQRLPEEHLLRSDFARFVSSDRAEDFIRQLKGEDMLLRDADIPISQL